MEKPTHTLRPNPQMSVRYLADYMAASEQARRTIVQGCKYKPTVRVVQHGEARTAISAAYANGTPDLTALKDRADFIRHKLADTEFEADVNDHNATYIERFVDVFPGLALPTAEVSAGKRFPHFLIGGVRITFALDLSLQRTTKTNKVVIGGAMFRYAKGRPLAPKVADFQSAFIYGRLREIADSLAGAPDRNLCLTIDAQEGIAHPAPSRSVYLFKEMKAACHTIAERWDKIPPPSDAVIAP